MYLVHLGCGKGKAHWEAFFLSSCLILSSLILFFLHRCITIALLG